MIIFFNKIIKYLHDFDDSVIPSEINGYSVTSFDTAVFINSNNLKTVTIPGSIRFLSSSAFSSPALREINVADNNLRYTSIDGVLYTKDKKSINLPKNATLIDFAFAISYETGLHVITGKVNNTIKDIFSKLENGDVVEIITSNKCHPESNWLNNIVSFKANYYLYDYFKNNINYKKNQQHYFLFLKSKIQNTC